MSPMPSFNGTSNAWPLLTLTYGTNVANAGGAGVVNGPGFALLNVSIVASAAVAAGAAILVLPVGSRPKYQWRGEAFQFPTVATVSLRLDTNGNVVNEQALVSGQAYYGSVVFPRAA